MIKIEIENIGQLKLDFNTRFNPLVKERIDFYLSFFNYLNSGIDYKYLSRLNVKRRDKVSLINPLITHVKLERMSDFKDKIADLRNAIPASDRSKFVTYLNNLSVDVEKILISEISDLQNLNSTHYSSVVASMPYGFKEMIEHIFDYDKFYIDENQDWGFGAEFARRLDLNVCPYCNRNYITTVIDKAKKIIGPTFDHFLPKSLNPLLRISMFNLIPSCTVCNSNLKHKTEFDLRHYLYPYSDEMSHDVYFDYFLKTFSNNKYAGENYQIVLVPKTILNINTQLKVWGDGSSKRGSAKVFKIEEVYAKAHGDIVGEIDAKCDKNSKVYAESVLGLLGNRVSDIEFYSYYFGNYLDKTKWNKRPLAKLTYDLVSKRLPRFKQKII